MNYNYKGEKYEIQLEDDGSLDTVININGITHRLSSEDRPANEQHFVQWLLEMSEQIIETDERYWDTINKEVE